MQRYSTKDYVKTAGMYDVVYPRCFKSDNFIKKPSAKCILLIFIIPLALCSQGTGESPFKHMAFGVSISPDIAYRALFDGGQGFKDYVKEKNELEMPQFGYSIGFKLASGQYNKWILEAGLLYCDRGYSSKREALHSLVPDPHIPAFMTAEYHYKYIDIPIKGSRFICQNDKHGFFTSVGLSPALLIASRTSALEEYSDGHTEQKEYKSSEFRIHFFALAGAGYQYRMSDHFLIRAQPVIRYQVTPFNKGPVKQSLYNAGIDLGIYYTL